MWGNTTAMRRDLNLNHHLERRHQTWLALLDVPADLREKVGRRRLVHSLETDDIRIARERRDVVLGAWRKHLASVRMGDAVGAPKNVEWGRVGSSSVSRFRQRALAWREELANTKSTAQREVIKEAIVEEAERMAPIRGEDERGEPIHSTAEFARAKAFIAVAMGAATLASDLLPKWHKESPKFAESTRKQHVISVTRFETWAEKHGVVASIEGLTKKDAGRFISECLGHLRPATIQREVSNLSSLWKWARLKGHGEDAPNPWLEQPIPGRGGGRKNQVDEVEPRNFTDEEMRKLLDGEADATLADMIRIAALSGMRAEEICQLRVSDTAGGVMTVRDGKTPAARRPVPIHSDLASIIARRGEGKAAEDFLFTDDELGLEKPGGNRSRAITKRFTSYRRKVGVDQPMGAKTGQRNRSAVTFHSFRHWFVSTATRAGQPDALVGAVVGHAPAGITLAVYGKGWPSLEQRRACVEAVRLPTREEKPIEPAHVAAA
jgi:integrase